MADEVDRTNDRIENETALTLADVTRKAAAIPKGEPGDCSQCGEWFARVVFVASINDVACGRCRDRRGLA